MRAANELVAAHDPPLVFPHSVARRDNDDLEEYDEPLGICMDSESSEPEQGESADRELSSSEDWDDILSSDFECGDLYTYLRELRAFNIASELTSDGDTSNDSDPFHEIAIPLEEECAVATDEYVSGMHDLDHLDEGTAA